MIVFAQLNAHLLIGDERELGGDYYLLKSDWENAPALNPEFIGNVERLIVVFAEVSVHPAKDLDSTTGNISNE